MAAPPTAPRDAIGHLEPRPVTGQREYSVRLNIKTNFGATALQDALAKLIEPAGAVRVAAESNATLLTYSPPSAPQPWGISIEAKKQKDTAEVIIRARPDYLSQYECWPDKAIVEWIASIVDRYEPRVGQTRASTKPLALAGHEARAWVERTLTAKDRDLPILLITPGPCSSPEIAEPTARELAGIALVYVAGDLDAPETLIQMLGKHRAVYGGAVRVYRPGFSPYDDPLDHDLLVTRYLDTALKRDWTLAAEIGHRILPLAGKPIPIPRAQPDPPKFELPKIERRVDRVEALEARIVELDATIRELIEENARLHEENRRLNAALRESKDQIRMLEGATNRVLPDTTSVAGLPWPLENPNGWNIELSDRFVDDIRKVARDRGLAEEVRNKMEAALLDPVEYGKPMRGARKGQNNARVANNYRLVWSVEGRTVRFVLIVSKEDPEYSPHGA